MKPPLSFLAQVSQAMTNWQTSLHHLWRKKKFLRCTTTVHCCNFFFVNRGNCFRNESKKSRRAIFYFRNTRGEYLCSVAICHPSECFCVCVGTKNQYLAPRKSNKGGFPQNRGRCGCCRRRRSSSNLKTFFSRIDVFRAGLHNCCCFFGRSCQQTTGASQ